MFVVINKKFVPSQKASISIRERGFLFGDGIFETLKIINGKIYDYESHEARICKGLEAYKIKADISDLEKLSKELIKKNEVKNGILRISISRGIGSLGYLPTNESRALSIIETLPERKIPNKKIILGISKNKKPDDLPSFKSMNSMHYVMNKIEAEESGVFDLVMISQENFISQTSSANIFWVKDGEVYTPSKACNIMAGTVRKKLLEISDVKIHEVKAKINSLKNCDEIFLTNSSFLILPVDELSFKNENKKLKKSVSNRLKKILMNDILR